MLREHANRLEARLEKLEAENQKLQENFDGAPCAYVTVDHSGAIRDANHIFFSLIGLRPTSAPGPLALYVAKADMGNFFHHLNRCRRGENPVRTQLALSRRSSPPIPVEMVSVPAWARGQKVCPVFRTLIIDLRERWKVEGTLVQRQHNFEDLLASLDGVVWQADAETLDVLFVSQSAQRLLGYETSHWYTPGFWAGHIYVEDRDRVLAEIAHALRAREPYFTLKYRVTAADRRRIWVRDQISARHEGGRLCLFGLMLDFTEQRDLEEKFRAANEQLERHVVERTAALQATIAELESVSYSLSHDLRAPLRVLQGYAHVLLSTCQDRLEAREMEFLRRMMQSTLRMDKLIQDVLTYSRIARSKVDFEKVELQPLVAGIINDYDVLQPDKATLRLRGELPAVHGHEALLSQCFSNLLTNAVKFVTRGVMPEVEIWSEKDGPWVQVYIKDNGIGIDPENQRRIFGIFERVNSPEEFEGTGIGLAIVQKAVSRMGGRLAVESAPGAGSTFRMQLPAARENDEP